MNRFQTIKRQILLPWLDILSLLGWGFLLLHYWLSGQLQLLIHPNYFILVQGAGFILVIIGILKLWQWLKTLQGKSRENEQATLQHITLFPVGVGSSLLVIAALAGFLITPAILNSQVALQRGVSESLPVTREQPQAFHASIKPEDRTLIDWVRTLNVYPEPDAYTGQKARVTGFVVHLPQFPENYFLLTRFVITCCAVDAYPVGLPVKVESAAQYPPDTWLEVEGEMMTDILQVDGQTLQTANTGKRQLVIVANSVTEIPTPADPYSY